MDAIPSRQNSSLCSCSWTGGAGVYRLECKDGPKIKDLFDRVANNRPLPDPPRRLTSSSWHSTSGDSDPGQSRSPLSPLPSSYYKDPGSLYTLPPSVNGGDNTSVQPHTPPSGPRLRSSERTSSMSPPDERPQLPPPQLKPAKQAEPDSNYENLNSAYDYVSIPAPRPIPEQVSGGFNCFAASYIHAASATLNFLLSHFLRQILIDRH